MKNENMESSKSQKELVRISTPKACKCLDKYRDQMVKYAYECKNGLLTLKGRDEYMQMDWIKFRKDADLTAEEAVKLCNTNPYEVGLALARHCCDEYRKDIRKLRKEFQDDLLTLKGHNEYGQRAWITLCKDANLTADEAVELVRKLQDEEEDKKRNFNGEKENILLRSS